MQNTSLNLIVKSLHQSIEEDFPYKLAECYTISEVAAKYAMSLPAACRIIRRNFIPRQKIGHSVYVPKTEIHKLMQNLSKNNKQ